MAGREHACSYTCASTLNCACFFSSKGNRTMFFRDCGQQVVVVGQLETGYWCMLRFCVRTVYSISSNQFSSLSVSFFVNQKLPTVFFCLATHVPFRVFHHVLTSTSWNEGSKTCDRSVFCRLDIVYAEYNREYSANQTDGPVTSWFPPANQTDAHEFTWSRFWYQLRRWSTKLVSQCNAPQISER